MLTPDTSRAWFRPTSISVAGASTQRVTLANLFLRRQREFGYDGALYVVHPEAAEIEGVRCVRSVRDVPGGVDYAYVAIPGAGVVDFLREAAGHVRVAQVISSGFRETGAAGEALEREMVAAAAAGGIRLVGPNCMGSYSPVGRLTMVDGAPAEAGDIGVVSQSGVAACDVIKLGGFMGGRFSQVLSVGNGADVEPVELLEHFVDDGATRVVGMYVEGLARGRAFVDALARAEGRKPVVVLKGGMTDQGRRSVSSHTGALATDHRIWQGLAAQFGATLKTSLDDFVGSVVGFSHWLGDAPAGRRCCVVGPGGVLSVLGTDLLRRLGLEVPRLGEATLARLEALRLPPGSSVQNPIDTPVGVMQAQGGRAFGEILRLVAASGEIDWFLVHVSIQNLYSYLGDPETALANSIAGFLDVARAATGARWCCVLRTNGDPDLEPVRARYRRQVAAERIPTFGRLEDAASAIADFVQWSDHTARLGAPDARAGRPEEI